MSAVSQGQLDAIYDAQGEVVTAGNAGTSAVETVVTATPFQISTTHAADVYINITTAASVTIAMGPTSAGNTISIAAAESEALGVTTLHVPAGWYIDLTGTVADFVVTAVLI